MKRLIALALTVLVGGCVTGASLARKGDFDGACERLADRGWLGRNFDHSEAESFLLAAHGASLHVKALSADALAKRTGAQVIDGYGKSAVVVELQVENAPRTRLEVLGAPELNSPQGESLDGPGVVVTYPAAPTAWVEEQLVPVSPVTQVAELFGMFTLITPLLSLISGQNVMGSPPQHVKIEHPTPEELAKWNQDPRVQGLARLEALVGKPDQKCPAAGGTDCTSVRVLGGVSDIASAPAQLCFELSDQVGSGEVGCSFRGYLCFTLPQGPTLEARLDALGRLPLDAPAQIHAVSAL